ncbi:MAG: phenylacetate-CoA oxygenase/reductase subunit PaaK [Betaproteobacteria bacterium]|nr:phenylacetate-CoA oxygenase/reductase subunit PaaK [Betaproteobacteria bacterium]
MTTLTRFHELTVAHVNNEAAGAVALTLTVPPQLRQNFSFEPGQFLTLKAIIDGDEVRRSYSICSPRGKLIRDSEIEIGIRPVNAGIFSNWAATRIKAGDRLDAMPPEGRFTVQRPRALHRVGFAAGSGITPILSIMASTLEEQPESKFTLVYGNRRMATVMFNEALQDLKDRYPSRLTLIHVLSRQVQEVDMLEGRIDAAKVRTIIDTLLPVASMDEVFICGPDSMIEATQACLLEAGVPANRIRTERFTSPRLEALPPAERKAVVLGSTPVSTGDIALTVVVDGKPHELKMSRDQKILDVALGAGLDLPWSCKGGVCCTCRAKVMEGSVQMEKNFTLESWELEKGFVLSCQARPTSERVVVSYDER